MPLPTLLIKGKLVPPDGNPDTKKLLDEWVPVEYIIEWFRSRLNKTGLHNRVLILKSETASGKSTAFPPELYRSLVMGQGGQSPGIICTQPRVLTAIENVNEMLKHYSSFFVRGETIGWSTKYNKLRPKSYGLLSATIGTLTQQLQTLADDELMRKYRFILIDETHERDLQTDMTLYMLKNFLLRNQNNPNCPFVTLMSATFDPQSFIDYFNLSLNDNFIWCRGETAGFDEMWDWNDDRTVNNFPQSAAAVVEKIVKENPNDDPATADILIFMPGKSEFVQTADWLHKLNKKLAEAGEKVFSLLQIEARAIQTQNDDYKKLMSIPTENHVVSIDGKKYTPGRRVIISTNVAETGLTLDNLKYVIDAGFNREIEYNPVLGIRGLITKPAPQSRIKQRRGRAGRKFRGVFYPLYPKYIFDALPELQFPQILIEDISSIAMAIIIEQIKVKSLGGDKDPQFDITGIDMVDPPSPDAMAGCLEKLYSIGFISPIAPPYDEVSTSNEGYTSNQTDNTTKRFGPTRLGMFSVQLNMLKPENARMIMAAYTWNCSVLDIITIAAYLSLDAKSFAHSDNLKQGQKAEINWTAVYKDGLPSVVVSGIGTLYKMRLLIADDFINGLILFSAVKNVLGGSETKKYLTTLRSWCTANNVSYHAILDLIKMRDDIIEQMLTMGLDIFRGEDCALSKSSMEDLMDVVAKIKHCIYDGYRNNILILRGNKYYTSMGLEVITPKLFREDEIRQAEKLEYGYTVDVKPRSILYKELSLKYKQKTSMYVVTAEQISTLDGIVSFDPDFII